MSESAELVDEGRDAHVAAIAFRVAEEEYAVPLTAVRELVRMRRITRVPRAPRHVLGVFNLHGNVVPVLDIARRFEIGEASADGSGWIVVVTSDGDPIGLLAESVTKVTDLQASAIRPPPSQVSGIAAKYVDGVAHRNGRFLIFLNLPATLDAPGTAETGRTDA